MTDFIYFFSRSGERMNQGTEIKNWERGTADTMEEIVKNNRATIEAEAISLMKDIEVCDPNDEWLYEKGLCLSYFGSLLGNEMYEKVGMEFFQSKPDNT